MRARHGDSLPKSTVWNGVKVIILQWRNDPDNEDQHQRQVMIFFFMWTIFIVFIEFVRREGQPTPIFLPGESHGQRSLVGFSPWGHKESDTTV